MGNKNSTYEDTRGYAIIMVRDFTLMGPLDLYYCINDKQQIHRITEINREEKKVFVSGKDTYVLYFDNRYPSCDTFLNAAHVLKKGTEPGTEIYFFPTPGAFCKNEGICYHFDKKVLVRKLQ